MQGTRKCKFTMSYFLPPRSGFEWVSLSTCLPARYQFNLPGHLLKLRSTVQKKMLLRKCLLQISIQRQTLKIIKYHCRIRHQIHLCSIFVSIKAKKATHLWNIQCMIP